MQSNSPLAILRRRQSVKHVSENPPPWPVDVVIPWCGLPQRGYCPYTNDLKYCIRSIKTNAPWVRKIILVVQDDFEHPPWMKRRLNKKEFIILKTQSFIEPRFLPTYNWHVIQSWLWAIKDLSEHFIVMHDDMYIARPTPWTCFFTKGEGLPINRHYPGPQDHKIYPNHFIPYVRMWSNAIMRYNIHNTRIQQQAAPYKKSHIIKYYKLFEKAVKEGSEQRHISGQHDFDLLRFTTALTTTNNEVVAVKTDDYDWRKLDQKQNVVDYFVESDDNEGLRNILSVKPRFIISNNSGVLSLQLHVIQEKLFPTPTKFEVRF